MSKGAIIAASIVGVLVAIVHFLTAGQYDLFRNELYFIVCGWRPSWGYVDQPPLVPLIAALMWMSHSVWFERLPGIISAIALVPITVAFAELLGANTRGAWVAAIAYASATLVTAMSATLSTSTFEPLMFTLVAYFIVRAIQLNDPRSFWWAGLVAGISFEMRYGILMWGIGLAAGLVIAGPRSIFRSRDFWIGIGIAIVIALPNGIWQIAHGFPFLELVRNDSSGNLIGTPLQALLQQLFLVNPLTAPVWITGIIAPFISKRLAPYRFLALTFVVTMMVIIASHGKAYYSAGLYPTIFALGAAAWIRLWWWFVAPWALLTAVNAWFAMPFVLPLMPPAKLQYVINHMGFKMQPMERAGIGAPLMQVFSDEFGWRDLATNVETVYASLPAADRAKAAIFAENYGNASAINVYGKDLPAAISGNNQYYLWGPGSADGSVVIAVDVNPAKWAALCNSATVVAHFGTSPYAMPYEVNRPIVVCHGMHQPLQQVWPQFKHYGIENLGTNDD